MASSSSVNDEAIALFSRLDKELFSEFGHDKELKEYFKEGREFGALHQVVIMLRDIQNHERELGEDMNFSSIPEYRNIVELRKLVNDIIEEVVTFQHGGLNNSVDTMSEVVKAYNAGREDIRSLRTSLAETQSVLTAKKTGQVSLKELWCKKAEIQETTRILKDLEFVKDAPLKVQRYIQQHRFLSAVMMINRATSIMFNEDLAKVTGIAHICEQILELKETVLERIVTELRDKVHESEYAQNPHDGEGDLESEDADQSDTRSESNRSGWNGSQFDSSSGLGAGFSTFSPAVTGTAANISSITDSMSLMDINESSEAALLDPATAGPVFWLLLVRAVGELRCEEDVERMLLESDGRRFRAVVKKHREYAAVRLRRRLEHSASHGTDYNSVENPEDMINMKLFSEYIGQLLEIGLSSIRKLINVLRLLSTCRKLRSGDPNPLSYSIKESNKLLIRKWWTLIEETLAKELQIHLIESSVEDIADIRTLPGNRGGSAEDVDDDEVDNASTLNSKPTFNPTVRLAAPVYRKVMYFCDSIKRIFYDEGIYIPQLASSAMRTTSTTTQRQSTAASMMSKPTPVPTITKSMSANGTLTVAATDIYNSKVLELVQRVLENELLPVVQSAVNSEMRDIQMKPEMFALPQHEVQAHLAVMSNNSSGLTVSYTPLISPAALSCARVATPLFHYWLQLPQHRDMVLTILDRLVRGFASSAKDEVEGLTYKLLSADSRYQKLVMSAVKEDPLYIIYKTKMYGKASIDEFVGSRGSVDNVSPGGIVNASSSRDLNIPSKSRSITGLTNISSGNGHNGGSATTGASIAVDIASSRSALELEGWADFWEVGSAKYVITKDKIAHDMGAIAEVAAILHGCDWLVSQLLKTCAGNMRKLVSSSPSSAASQSSIAQGVSATSRQPLSSSPSKPRLSKIGTRQDINEIQSPMWNVVQGACTQLGKLADGCIAIIRSELQVVCFSHLHVLATMRSLQFDPTRLRSQQHNGGNSAGDHSNDDSHEAESVVNDLIAHLKMLLESVQFAVSSEALASIVAPIFTLVPRILLKCAQYIADPSVGSTTIFVGSSGRSDSSIVSLDRSTVLRTLVTCQQGLSGLLESCHLVPLSHRRLFDTLSEEFERMRRFITLLDMPSSELHSYIEKNMSEFSEDDYQILWRNMCKRFPESPEARIQFSSMWSELSSRRGRTVSISS